MADRTYRTGDHILLPSGMIRITRVTSRTVYYAAMTLRDPVPTSLPRAKFDAALAEALDVYAAARVRVPPPERGLDLDALARLSERVTRCEYIVDDAKNVGENWLVGSFGNDGETGMDAVIVTTKDVRGSDHATEGACADADLVAALLTHRDELIRLARIGQEHDRE